MQQHGKDGMMEYLMSMMSMHSDHDKIRLLHVPLCVSTNGSTITAVRVKVCLPTFRTIFCLLTNTEKKIYKQFIRLNFSSPPPIPPKLLQATNSSCYYWREIACLSDIHPHQDNILSTPPLKKNKNMTTKITPNFDYGFSFEEIANRSVQSPRYLGKITKYAMATSKACGTCGKYCTEKIACCNWRGIVVAAWFTVSVVATYATSVLAIVPPPINK